MTTHAAMCAYWTIPGFDCDCTPETTLVLDVDRSDETTGLEVWTDSGGKVRRRSDGLWDAATRIWGTPRTSRERGRRNTHIKELRDAGVSPAELTEAFGRAVVMWGGTRPGLNGIIVNLGDLIEGVTVTPDEVRRYQNEQGREQRRSSLLRAVE
jgi:hypothetical protein